MISSQETKSSICLSTHVAKANRTHKGTYFLCILKNKKNKKSIIVQISHFLLVSGHLLSPPYHICLKIWPCLYDLVYMSKYCLKNSKQCRT